MNNFSFVHADKKRVVKSSGQFLSLGAMAIALAACGGDFKLADDAVSVTGNSVKVKFNADPKKVSKVTTDYKVDSSVSLSSVTSSGSEITFKFSGESDSIKITAETDKTPIKDNKDKAFTFKWEFDTKAPEATKASKSGKVVTIEFSDKITKATASKFKIDGEAATKAVVNSADETKVDVTFANDVTANEIEIAADAVEDDAASKTNTSNNKNVKETQDIGAPASDKKAPALAATDPVVINKADKTITIKFNEDLDSATVSAKIVVNKDGTKIDGYTLKVTGSNLVITTVDALADGEVYKVTLSAGAVKDKAGNANDDISEQTATVAASVEDDGLIGLADIGSSDYGF